MACTQMNVDIRETLIEAERCRHISYKSDNFYVGVGSGNQ